jgi:hypothetical protein
MHSTATSACRVKVRHLKNVHEYECGICHNSRHIMVKLRSGYSLCNGPYDFKICAKFLNGEYPDCSSFSLSQLRQLKFTMEEYLDKGTSIALENSKEEIVNFLLSQWRMHHEGIVRCSTPCETSTYQRMREYCGIRDLETDDEFEFVGDEFFCHTCGQYDCVKLGFRGPGFNVHSPLYGVTYSHFRTDKIAHKNLFGNQHNEPTIFERLKSSK